MLIRESLADAASPMLPGAAFEADVVLVAPREFEITRAQRTYREKNFTTFTELLNVNAFQTEYIKRVNEALGLEALASYLREAGIRVAIINCNVAPHTPAEVAAKVRASKARVCGISLIYRPQVAFALDLLQALEGVSDVRVCMGGALASFMPRELLGSLTRLDAVIYGEAEETFRDYCIAVLGSSAGVRRSGPFPMFSAPDGISGSLAGVAYRDGGYPVLNAPAPPLDLRRVRMPARDTLTYLDVAGWPNRIASIYTSRGCMAKCTFCTGKDAYNVERMRTYRFRDAVDVVDEMQYLREAFGVRFVYINDDNFLGYGRESYARVRKIAEEMIARKLNIQFASECRVDGLELDLLLLLKEAGMRQVLLGIESGSDAVLTRWRKGATVRQNTEAIETIQKAGIALEPGFILFDADTSGTELAQNLDFIRRTGLNRTPIPTYLVNRLSVYPGTEAEQILVASGTIAPSPIRYGGRAANNPKLIVDYFQRMEYVCRDRRSEITWRGLRRALEPVEIFLEIDLPAVMSVLVDCRGHHAAPELRAEGRSLMRAATAWRRRVGDLVTTFLQRCVEGYAVTGHARQWRWLTNTLRAEREAYALETLGMRMEEFTERVLRLRRKLVPQDVCVVIPTAGKWSRLRRTLSSLARQQTQPELRWEIIVVLDGVTPPQDFEFSAGSVPVRTIRSGDRPRGRGAARNAGIAASRAEIVILLDDDTVAAPGLVQQHWEAQCRQASLCHGPIRELTALAVFNDLDDLSSAHVIDGAASSRMRAWARRVLLAIERPEENAERFGSVSRLERDGVQALERCRMTVAWVAFAGANLSAPRKWFLEDGFSESSGTRWGLEDIALALRWAIARKPLSLAAGAMGLHLSHVRHDWKEEQRRNFECLSFLPAQAARSVYEYLEGDMDAAALHRAMQPIFAEARVSPSGSNRQLTEAAVANR